MNGPCELCGCSPDLGQPHTPTCPTQHAPGTVYADYRRVSLVKHRPGPLHVGIGIVLTALTIIALVVLIGLTADDDRCKVLQGADGQLVEVCTP